MPAHPLDAASQRVLRASEHLDDLRKLLGIFERENHEIITAELQAQDWREIGDLRRHVLAPMEIPIRIGEICYNTRTALEYLVFELAKLDSGQPQDFTQFPIVDTKDKFRSWRKD